jgi:hypothetical protein
VSWSLHFAAPIVLEDGVKLTTPREAVAHLRKAASIKGRNSKACGPR